MFRIIFAAATIASTVVVMRPTPHAAPNRVAPSVPAEAVAMATGGPAFAQTPPPGFPASFAVTYSGPDGAFATTCYYAGRNGEIMRWASVPVSTAEMAGPVEITFHTGIKISQPTPLIPSGAWRTDVGNVSLGNTAAPVGGRMQRFARTPMETGVVPMGYMTIN